MTKIKPVEVDSKWVCDSGCPYIDDHGYQTLCSETCELVTVGEGEDNSLCVPALIQERDELVAENAALSILEGSLTATRYALGNVQIADTGDYDVGLVADEKGEWIFIGDYAQVVKERDELIAELDKRNDEIIGLMQSRQRLNTKNVELKAELQDAENEVDKWKDEVQRQKRLADKLRGSNVELRQEIAKLMTKVNKLSPGCHNCAYRADNVTNNEDILPICLSPTSCKDGSQWRCCPKAIKFDELVGELKSLLVDMETCTNDVFTSTLKELLQKAGVEVGE